jgi:glycosyltransferase involved in cell wall biosynthesis
MSQIHDIEFPRNLDRHSVIQNTANASGRSLDTFVGAARRVWAKVWPQEIAREEIPDKPVDAGTGLPLAGLVSIEPSADGQWQFDSVPGAMPSGNGHLNTLVVWADFHGSQYARDVAYFSGAPGGGVTSDEFMMVASGSQQFGQIGVRVGVDEAKKLNMTGRGGFDLDHQRVRAGGMHTPMTLGISGSADMRGRGHAGDLPNDEMGKDWQRGVRRPAGIRVVDPVAMGISGSADTWRDDGLEIGKPADAHVPNSGFYIVAAKDRPRNRKRVLWVGDAVSHTGFATVTHSVLDHLRAEWDVHVLGVNYDGRTHKYPYPIFEARRGGDMWGLGCFDEVCRHVNPDVVVVNNDWWNVAQFLRLKPRVPMVAYMPVDGKNLDPQAMETLSDLSMAVWYTRFGRDEAVRAGYTGASEVVAHGVDAKTFKHISRGKVRKKLRMPIPDGAFVVSNINRNQPRKRLDLTIQYFSEWMRGSGADDAYLYLHCSDKDVGWNVSQLADYYGISDRLLLPSVDHAFQGFPRRRMPQVYSAADVQVSTTLGEGWGLTTMEGMACGVPQVVPSWAALGEWPKHVAAVQCRDTYVHPQFNTIGGVPEKDDFIARLNDLYENADARKQQGKMAHRHVRKKSFRWSHIAGQFDGILSQVIA